jgi:tetratricopeptide (TPR) repeat protein
MMRVVGDRSRLFSVALVASWLLIVTLPLVASIALGDPLQGLPLLGVLLWFGLLRLARYLSPAARADALMRRGRAAEVLALADRALAVKGSNAWSGSRRLVWLNRRTTALLLLGRAGEALAAALEAVALSPDPETLSNLALALLRLNRYEEAARTARVAIDLTRERSVLAHTVYAMVKLAQGMPAEAEALSRAGLMDVQALLPLVRPEHHVACLVALTRAERAQGEREVAIELVRDLKRAAHQSPPLRAAALLEEAQNLGDTPKDHDRAFALLNQANERDPHYTRWYITQPGTLAQLREDERFAAYTEAATEELDRIQAGAPDAERVAQAVEVAQQDAMARPAQQSSRAALALQVLTLAATLLLLLAWTWRFFVLAG